MNRELYGVTKRGGIAGIADGCQGISPVHIHHQIADDARRSVYDVEVLGIIVAEKKTWAERCLVVRGRTVAEHFRRQVNEVLVGHAERIGVYQMSVLIDEIGDVQQIVEGSVDVADTQSGEWVGAWCRIGSEQDLSEDEIEVRLLE